MLPIWNFQGPRSLYISDLQFYFPTTPARTFNAFRTSAWEASPTVSLRYDVPMKDVCTVYQLNIYYCNWNASTKIGSACHFSFSTVLHEDEVFPITGKANVRVRESIVFYLVVQDTICLTLSQRRLFHLHFPDNCGLVGEVTKFSTKSVIEESISFSSELPPHCRTTTD